MQGSQEDLSQVPIGADDDRVEVDEPEQAEGGEAEKAQAEFNTRPSDWHSRASGNKMLPGEDGLGESPWKGAPVDGIGREGGQEDDQVDVKDIDIDGFDGAKNAAVRGGDIDMGGAPKMEFERHWCFGTACTSIRRILNVAGAVAAMTNAAVDVIYAYRTRYVLASIFQLTCAFLILRVLGTIAAGQYYYTKYVRNYRASMGDVAEEKNVADEGEEEEGAEEDGHRRSKNYQEGVTLGQHLYSAMHLLLYTGFFRLLPSRDFPYELGVGYSLELFLSMVPMLFCIIFNNAETIDLTPLQSAAMLLKICSLLALLAELILMIWEISLNRRYAKLGFANSKKLSEEQRRREWGKKLSWVAVIAMGSFIVILIIGVLTTSSRACGAREALSSATCVKCADPKCGDCSEDPQVCLGKCDSGHYLGTDGACVRCDGQPLTSTAALRCLKCTPAGGKAKCTECASRHRAAGDLCLPCQMNVEQPYEQVLAGKACISPGKKVNGATDPYSCHLKLEQDAKNNGGATAQCKKTEGYFTFTKDAADGTKNECSCCAPKADANENLTNLRDSPNSNLYVYKREEAKKERDEIVNKKIAAGASQVYCEGCDNIKCTKCSKGSSMRGGYCIPCRENLIHCKRCVTGDNSKCAECDYNVADKNEDGLCNKCREDGGWKWSEEKQRCDCNAFVNVKEGRKCQSCESLIPGCGQCTQTDFPPLSSTKIYIGFDQNVANSEKGKYIICKQCADGNMIQQDVTVKDEKGVERVTTACKFCGELIKGCKTCKSVKLPSGAIKPECAVCKRNFYLVRTGDDTICKPCTEWGQSCVRCTLGAGCTDCGAKYWELGGICIKSWF